MPATLRQAQGERDILVAGRFDRLRTGMARSYTNINI